VALWQRYQDQGVEVWGISEEGSDALNLFRNQLDLSFPILIDEGGAVLDQYSQQLAFLWTAYPQDWVIGADGRVAYVNNAYQPDELISTIERELP